MRYRGRRPALHRASHGFRPLDAFERNDSGRPLLTHGATEFAARLPYELGLRLADSKTLTPKEKQQIRSRMQRIEDVRPLLASLSWAYYEAERLPKRRRVLMREWLELESVPQQD